MNDAGQERLSTAVGAAPVASSSSAFPPVAQYDSAGFAVVSRWSDGFVQRQVFEVLDAAYWAALQLTVVRGMVAVVVAEGTREHCSWDADSETWVNATQAARDVAAKPWPGRPATPSAS
jgi:hypothetical protein